MDRLTKEERARAWAASWHPSFVGMAIVNRDFTFRSVNPQFCKLLGVTPADLIGRRFQDITPPGVKELDEKNAEMVINGLIDFYLLPKRYEFSGGQKVDIILLVTGVFDENRNFLFFVSRIMLDENGELFTPIKKDVSRSEQFYQQQMRGAVAFLAKYSKWFLAIGTALGAALVVIGKSIKGISQWM